MFVVVPETLRKYPLSASVNRLANEDYPVSGTKHVIEKGTWIKMPVYAVQHDPDIYPDPEKFDPDRFENNASQEHHIMSLLSFGQGPRNCIGQRFALMNLQIVVIMLLKNFEILPCDKTPKSIVFNPKRTVLCSNQNIILEIRPINS